MRIGAPKFIIYTTKLEIGSVPPHSGSMVYSEFNGKITAIRDNLDESECGGADPISNEVMIRINTRISSF